ncbi:MAG: histidine kinase [Bacteroidales bacterium]|nr:histidine kinase [Bacteroidales bacterium]
MKKVYTIILFLYSTILIAQHYTYRHYTIFEGLPQNQVMCLHIDDNGFLWLGTKGGICRFDGKKFVSFDSNQPEDKYVLGIFTLMGENYYYTHRKVYKQNGDSFISIFEYDDKIFAVEPVHKENALRIIGSREVFLYKDDVKDKILVLGDTCRITGAVCTDSNVHLFSTNDCVYSVNDSKIKNVFDQKNNELYYKMWNSYFWYYDNLNKNKLTFYDYGNKDKHEIFVDATLNLSKLFVVSKDKIILRYGFDTWALVDLYKGKLASDSISDVQINDVVEYNNNYFFATENGLYILSTRAFANYTESDGVPKYVWSILESEKNEIILASYPGKMAKIGDDDIISSLNIEIPELLSRYGARFYMDGFCSTSGDWVIPMGGGAFIGTEENYSFVVMLKENKLFTPFCSFEDTSNNLIYFGTNNGIYSYDKRTEKLENFYTDGHNVLDIEEDKFGRIVFCTTGGVYLFENNLLVKPNSNDSVFNSVYVCCCRDNYGNMWFGNKLGLFVYNYDTIKKVYNGAFTCVNNYQDSHIIAGSTFGILYLDLNKFYLNDKSTMRYFDRYNGFIGKECGQNGTCIDAKGNVWMPTSESVVKFMPEHLDYDTIPPQTYLSNLQISGHDLDWDIYCSFPILKDSIYKINWDKHNLKFVYHGIDYTCPERVKYKYRLLGYSNKWISDSTGVALYTNLKPGKYTFEVLACNENGFWTKEPASIKIHIKPAFWQTLWFEILMIIIAILIIVSITYFLFNRKRKREKEKQKVEKMLVNMQMSTLNAQLDPHFVFNAISAIGTEVHLNNNDKAYDYFVKVTRLLRSSLIDKDRITRSLDAELKIVKDYLQLQKLRFEKRVNYKIEVNKNVNLDMMVPKMCIQVFVENAVKHGLENKLDGGMISVRVQKNFNYLDIEIEDDGLGRKLADKISKPSTGIGLKAIVKFFEITNKYNKNKAYYEVIDLYNKDIAVGTLIKLKIPDEYKYTN